MNDTLVYTICTSDYDYLFPKNTSNVLPNCDVKVLCVDCKIIPYPYGVNVDKETLPKFKTNFLLSRYLKTNIYRIFPNYKNYVYLDGNVIVKKKFSLILDSFVSSKKIIFIKKHPYRNTLIQEFKHLLKSKKIMSSKKKLSILNQMSSLKKMYYNLLLTENNIFMFKKKPKVEKYLGHWFEEIQKWETRDQLSNSISLKMFSKEEIFLWTPSETKTLYHLNGHKNSQFPYSIYNWIHSRRHIFIWSLVELITRPVYYLFLKIMLKK